MAGKKTETRKKSETSSQRRYVTKKVNDEVNDSEFEEEEQDEENDDLDKKIEKAMEKVMNKFRTSIRKEMREQFGEMEKSLNFQGEKMEEFLIKMDRMTENQLKLEKENEELKMELKSVKMVVEELEQYTRNKNIQIDGIPEEKDENLKQLMIDIGKKIQVEIEEKEIDAIHRIPSTIKNKNALPIVVQFTTRQLRETIMTKVRKTKITTKDLNKGGEIKPIFINEHLTKTKKQIMFEARKIKFEKAYKFLWSRNGKVLIRKDENSRVFELKTFDDLQKIA